MAGKKGDPPVTRDGNVVIQHEGVEGTATCRPSALPVWLDLGWTVVSDKKKGSARKAASDQSGTETPEKDK